MSYAIPGARALAFVVTAAVAITAGAAGQRSFVASNGNDANPCTLTQPCRGFATAVTNTNDGGEVIVLDSAGYGAVTITKSITIAAPAGVYAGVTVFAGDGVTVNGSSIIVVLRGLSVNWQGGTNGISFVQGDKLLVQDCEIGGIFQNAIYASAPSGFITVRNTTLRKSDFGFYALNSVRATLDAVRLYDNTNGVYADTGSRVSVANSVISDSGNRGVASIAVGTGTTDLTVTRSVVARCSSCFLVGAQAGASARLVSDGNTITDAGAAFWFSNAGGTEIIYTAGNNSVGFANAVIVGGQPLTPCCAM